MTRKTFITLVAASLMTLGGAAAVSAQEGDVDSIFYDFSDMDIDGDLRRPDGSGFVVRQGPQFRNLANLQRSFIPEVSIAAEEEAIR